MTVAYSLLFDIADGASTKLPSPGDRFVVASFVEYAKGNRLGESRRFSNPCAWESPSKRNVSSRSWTHTAAVPKDSCISGYVLDRVRDGLCWSTSRRSLHRVTRATCQSRCRTAVLPRNAQRSSRCARRMRRTTQKWRYTARIWADDGVLHREQAGRPSDLELMSTRLPGKLKSLGITVVDRPSFGEKPISGKRRVASRTTSNG